MSNSSATLKVSDQASHSGGQNAYGEQESPRMSGRSHSTERMDLPSFDAKLYAATSRMAGRMNAASVSDHEFEVLLRERQNLLDKKYSSTASPQDLNRLEYVRWSLERIEDAKYGHGFEQLEVAVASYERLLGEIGQLTETLDSRKASRKGEQRR